VGRQEEILTVGRREEIPNRDAGRKKSHWRSSDPSFIIVGCHGRLAMSELSEAGSHFSVSRSAEPRLFSLGFASSLLSRTVFHGPVVVVIGLEVDLSAE